MSFNSHSVWLWSFPIYNSALDLQSHAACLRKAILKRHRQGSFLYLLQFHYILSCHDPFLLNSRLVNILHISSFVLSRYLSVLRIQRLQFFFKTFTQHCHHTISNFIKEKKKRAILSSTHSAVKFPRYGKDQNEMYRKALLCELPVKSNSN